MNVVTLGMRNAFRNRTRTTAIIAILGLSIGLSLLMLISYQAVQQKITDTKGSIGNTVTIRPAGNTGMIGGNSSTLSADKLNGVTGISHVKDEVNILTDNLSTEGSATMMGASSDSPKTSLKSPIALKKSTDSNGVTTYSGGGLMVAGGLPENFSPPMNIAGSSEPTNENTVAGGSSIKVTSGKAIDGTKDSDEAMLSEAMAKKNGLKVGDTFTAYDTTLTVTALFKAETESGNNTIIVSLPAEQRLSDRTGQVSTAVATIDSLDNLKSATNAIKSKLGSDADVTSALDQADKALQPLASVKKVAMFSLFGSVITGGVVILMMMVMIVRERRREIGILKAIGASNLRIVLQFTAEALTLTLIGAIVGLIIGVVGGHPVTASLVDSSVSGSTSSVGGLPPRPSMVNIGDLKDIQTQIGFSVILFGLGGALTIAMLGSSFAGWLIAKVRPSEVMRQD
jgi:putative ABC transport system permease protein